MSAEFWCLSRKSQISLQTLNGNKDYLVVGLCLSGKDYYLPLVCIVLCICIPSVLIFSAVLMFATNLQEKNEGADTFPG